MPTSINPSNQTISQYALQVGAANNNLTGVADVATGQVLISGGVSANPSFSAYPQISGLGIGASPGSTAGITFDGSNFLNNYAVSTWTPTIDGAVSGSTTYTSQNGYYTRIGNTVICIFSIVITGATGTGNATIGGFPFTIKNQTNGYPIGGISFNGASWAWPASTAYIVLQGVLNTTTALIVAAASGVAAANVQMSNAALTLRGTLTYQI